MAEVEYFQKLKRNGYILRRIKTRFERKGKKVKRKVDLSNLNLTIGMQLDRHNAFVRSRKSDVKDEVDKFSFFNERPNR